MIRQAASTFAILAIALGAPIAVTPAFAASAGWTVQLAGNTEVPGPGSATGAGVAMVNVDDSANAVCYSISVVRIGQATMAHIHTGAAGVSGPPAVPLSTPGANGMVRGCARVSHNVAAAILANPSGYYINIHTADFPEGALRGQLASN